MKKITIPKEPAKITHSDGEAIYSFSIWVDNIIDATPEYGKGGTIAGKVNAISKIVEDADKSDKYFLLEEADYKLLEKALDSTLPTIFTRRAEAAGYYKAVKDAEVFEPKVLKEDDKPEVPKEDKLEVPKEEKKI